ncbi:membrane protein, partial [Elstera litoralis]
MRIIWAACGGVALVLAIVGILLPLLPTTPFLLLAAFAFARSSPRLEAWLLHHPRLGPPIRNWREQGAIDRKTKRVALASMAATPLGSWAIGVSDTVLVVQIILLCGAASFVA